MSQGVIGTRVKLDGEKEYKDALAALNRSYKTLTDELAYVTERYADNAESAEALQAKGEMLQKQLDKQRETVATLEKALESVNGDYDESSKVVQEWEQKLFRAKTETLKLEKALQQNEQALSEAEDATGDYTKALKNLDKKTKEANEGVKGLGSALKELGGKLGVNVPEGAETLLNKLGGLDAGFVASAGAALGMAAALAAVVKSLFDCTTEAANNAVQLSRISESAGLSTTSAQKWDYVLKSVGSSLESASGDLSGFQQKIVEASQGAGESAELFKKLGLYVWDASGNLKTTEQMLPELIEKLQGMSDTTERNAIANKLLGGTGTALIPILNQTGDELEALIEEKEKLGILSEGEIEDLKQTAQAQEDFTNAVEAAKNQLAQSFAPAVTAVYEMASNIVSKLSKWLQESGILDWLSSLVQIVAQIISRLVSVAGAITGFLNKFSLVPVMVKVALAPLKFLADTLSVILGAVEGILGGDWDSFQNALNSFGKSAGDTNETSVEDIEKNYGRGTDGYIRSGSNIFNERTKRWEGNYSVDSRIQGIIETVDERPELIEDKSIGATWRLVSSAAVGSKEALSRARGYNAAGIDHWPGGMTWVGENGPERVWLPEGTRIQTAQESRAGGDTFHITIPARDIKEFNDIVRIAKNARRAERMGTT